MSPPLKLLAFDHLEIAVTQLEEACEPFLRLGFEKVATRENRERQLRSYLLQQNRISLVLSASSLSTDPVKRFCDAHGPGVMRIGFLCDDAIQTFQTATNRGARGLGPPKTIEKDFGTVDHAAIQGLKDLAFVFISRRGSLFHEGFDVPVRSENRGAGLEAIEFLSLHLEAADWPRLNRLVETIFGWNVSPMSGWEGDTELNATRTWEAPNAPLHLTLNREGHAGMEKVSEFLKIFHGSGVRHLGLASHQLMESVRTLKRGSLPFLPVARAYYESLKERVPGLKENLNELEALGILAEVGGEGYTLLASTQNLLGPLAVNLVERKGGTGLGGNSYRDWLLAADRAAEHAGVIHATE